MPRTCTVCRSTDRRKVDAAVLQGLPYRDIANIFSLSRSAVDRHADKHIPKRLATSHRARELADAQQLADQLEFIERHTRSILDEARGAGKSPRRDASVALRAIARLERQAELRAAIREILRPRQPNPIGFENPDIPEDQTAAGDPPEAS